MEPLTPELTELRDTPVAYDCGRVAMESTGICWMPVWRVLQPDFSLKPANPYFIKQLPDRKKEKNTGVIALPNASTSSGLRYTQW